MKYNIKITIVAFVLMAGIVHAEDFGTINGHNYDGVTVMRSEADGIVVKTKSGIAKLYFSELSQQVQQKYHYDPAQAAQFAAEQNAAVEAYNAKAVAAQNAQRAIEDARRAGQSEAVIAALIAAQRQAADDAAAAAQAARRQQSADGTRLYNNRPALTLTQLPVARKPMVLVRTPVQPTLTTTPSRPSKSPRKRSHQ